MTKKKRDAEEPESQEHVFVQDPTPETAPMSLGDADDALNIILKLLGPLQKSKDIIVTANVAQRDLGLVQGKLAEAETKLTLTHDKIAQAVADVRTKADAERAKLQREDAALTDILRAKREELAGLLTQIEDARREHRERMQIHQEELALILEEKANAERFLESGRKLFDRKPIGV